MGIKPGFCAQELAEPKHLFFASWGFMLSCFLKIHIVFLFVSF